MKIAEQKGNRAFDVGNKNVSLRLCRGMLSWRALFSLVC